MILVDVYIPSVDAVYDFQLDENAQVDKIIRELVDMIGKKLKWKGDENAENFLLYAMDRGEELIREQSLAFSGVGNGDRLLLV